MGGGFRSDRFCAGSGFSCHCARQALHAFLAKERERSALVLIMTAAAALAVGMMESATLGAMTPINLVFMFSLAQLAGISRESVSR